MLPESRTQDGGFAIPRFDLTPRDVEEFLDELQAFHDHFRSCFSRSEPRGHFFNSMVGQCSELERTSIEPMALEVAGGNVRGMQRFLSDDIWDEDKMRQTSHGLVAAEMGDPEGVLMVDESGFVKKGRSPWEWPGSIAVLSARWRMVRLGWLPPRPRGMAMLWWTSGCSCPRPGSARTMRSAGTRVTCPRS